MLAARVLVRLLGARRRGSGLAPAAARGPPVVARGAVARTRRRGRLLRRPWRRLDHLTLRDGEGLRRRSIREQCQPAEGHRQLAAQRHGAGIADHHRLAPRLIPSLPQSVDGRGFEMRVAPDPQQDRAGPVLKRGLGRPRRGGIEARALLLPALPEERVACGEQPRQIRRTIDAGLGRERQFEDRAGAQHLGIDQHVPDAPVAPAIEDALDARAAGPGRAIRDAQEPERIAATIPRRRVETEDGALDLVGQTAGAARAPLFARRDAPQLGQHLPGARAEQRGAQRTLDRRPRQAGKPAAARKPQHPPWPRRVGEGIEDACTRRRADPDAVERLLGTQRRAQHVLRQAQVAAINRDRKSAPRACVEGRHHRRRVEQHQRVVLQREAVGRPRRRILDMDRGQGDGVEDLRGHGCATSA